MLHIIKTFLLFSFIASHAIPGMGQDSFPFFIKGKIDSIPGAMYEVYYTNHGQAISDTVYLDDNREFFYSGTLSEPSRFSLLIENKYDERLVRQYTAYMFWVEPHATILFEGKKKLRDKIVQDSPIEGIDQEFIKQLDKLRENEKNLTSDEYTVQKDKLYSEFIIDNRDNYYSIWLINSRLILDKDEWDLDTAKWLFSQVSPDLKKTAMGQKINRILQLSVGDVLPDFELTDTASNIVRLSSFRGKYVLVDFWASWCAPCRRQHPYMLEAYQKYGKDLEIISISLDEEKENWLKAIHDDKMTWLQLSDLKGFANKVAVQYGIHGIPENFLLDRNGKIMGRGLIKEDLEIILKALFVE